MSKKSIIKLNLVVSSTDLRPMHSSLVGQEEV